VLPLGCTVFQLPPPFVGGVLSDAIPYRDSQIKILLFLAPPIIPSFLVIVVGHCTFRILDLTLNFGNMSKELPEQSSHCLAALPVNFWVISCSRHLQRIVFPLRVTDTPVFSTLLVLLLKLLHLLCCCFAPCSPYLSIRFTSVLQRLASSEVFSTISSTCRSWLSGCPPRRRLVTRVFNRFTDC